MGLIAAVALGTAPRPALAAGAKTPATARAKKGAPAVTVNVPALTEKLKNGDPVALEAGLNEARTAGKGAAPVAPLIEELVQRGVPGDLTGLALDALGAIGSESSSAAIAPYGRHRNPDIRKKALTALSRTGGSLAAATLRAALSDPDAGVRGVAASGLGTVKSRDAVQDLFAALDHDVTEAAGALGQICTPDECEKLASKLSTLGLDVMTSAFDSILFRPAAEIPDDEKIRIVEHVRDLRTAEANKYLRDVQSRWPARESPRVKQALEQAVAATAGAKT
jgi:HEAT repeat protein